MHYFQFSPFVFVSLAFLPLLDILRMFFIIIIKVLFVKNREKVKPKDLQTDSPVARLPIPDQSQFSKTVPR